MVKSKRIREILKDLAGKSGLNSLSAREKWAVAGGVIFVICFLFLKIAVFPFFDARKQVAQSLERKKQELVEMRLLQEEYRSLQAQEGTIQSQISVRDPRFSLFTFLDQQSERSGVKKQIKSMKPSTVEGEGDLDEALVDMQLQALTLSQLVAFLELVESESFVVFVKRISIQENNAENGSLDVNLQLATFVAKVE